MDVVAAGYDVIGPRYRDWSVANSVRLGFVDAVLDRLPEGSTVIDLGCGPGDPATRMLSEKHRVVGVDVSRAQLLLASRFAPRAQLVRADISALALRPGSVDAVVSFYALGHLPGAAHTQLFRSIARWLRPGGLLLTSVPVTAGDGIEPDWLGVPMFFGGIGARPSLEALEQAGLHVEHADLVPEDEGDGRVVEFLWVTATTDVSRGAAAVAGPPAYPR